MIRHTIVASLIYLSLVAQPSLSQGTSSVEFRPWLPGLALVTTIVTIKGFGCLAWAGVLGLGVDCLSPDGLGIHLIIATMVASGLIRLRNDGHMQGRVFTAVFVFAGCFLWRFVASLIHGMLDQQSPEVQLLIELTLKESCSTTVLVVVFLISQQILGRVMQRKRDASVVIGNRWSMLNEV